MEFKDLIKQVKATKAIAEMDVGSDPRTYVVKLGKQRRALEDLKQLFVDYKREVTARVVFIVARGAGSEKFNTMSEAEGCFMVDAEGVYKDTIKNMNPVLYKDNPANPSLLDTVMNYFQDVADEIGVVGYPMLIYKNSYARTLRSEPELLEFAKKAINDDIGSDIVGHYAIHKVASMALEEEFTGKIIPIVLDTRDDNLAELLGGSLKRFTPMVFVVDTTEEVDKNQVTDVLKKIKDSIKKKK